MFSLYSLIFTIFVWVGLGPRCAFADGEQPSAPKELAPPKNFKWNTWSVVGSGSLFDRSRLEIGLTTNLSSLRSSDRTTGLSASLPSKPGWEFQTGLTIPISEDFRLRTRAGLNATDYESPTNRTMYNNAAGLRLLSADVTWEREKHLVELGITFAQEPYLRSASSSTLVVDSIWATRVTLGYEKRYPNLVANALGWRLGASINLPSGSDLVTAGLGYRLGGGLFVDALESSELRVRVASGLYFDQRSYTDTNQSWVQFSLGAQFSWSLGH